MSEVVEGGAVASAKGPPATITIERRWAIGGAIATALVIIAMAIALVAVSGGRDDGPFDRGGAISSEVGPQGGGMPVPPSGGGFAPGGAPQMPDGVAPQTTPLPGGGSSGSGSGSSGGNGSSN